MKALILAAGYATRLYPLTKDRAKPLLPVAGKPIIQYIIEGLEEVKELDQIYVVTNNKFAGSFEEFFKSQNFKKPVKVINDGTLSDDDKLGAIGDMHYVVQGEKIDDDLMVLAGDNIFEIGMNEMIDFFKSKKGAPCIASYDVKNRGLATQYGIVELSDDGKVVRFVEKPKDPPGTNAAVGLYVFPKNKVHLIKDYIEDKQNKDAPGYYISWLTQKDEVYAFPLRGKWYDIGDLGSYEKANKEFELKLNQS